MNRALKNKTRGQQKFPVPPVPKPGTAQNIQNFDGRTNTAAGQYETQATRGTSAEGMQVNWLGIVEKQ